ncbi:PspC domain-containing protein [Arthrobacter sp. efr-133-TYG-104]|uniref:PspC domain-containing protein n=1 Tax=Arthrobacter sp. efr-133-TYG-104 TaxID=3040324 RepID=UPI0025510DFF|nr:PspC domain-containing protein [Arthrobacter sp. efr-133-TYG-104]
MNANSTDPEGAGTPGSTEVPGNGAPTDAPGTAPQQNFFDWIRGQGIQRGPDRWVGGVSSGIAHRLGIDPMIVRGIFIVLALFAGIGVLLYGLAWALLPEPDGRIHVQEAGNGHWTTGMTGALVTSIIGLPSLGRGFWGWGGNGLAGLFWTLLWMGAIAYLIYFLVQRNRSVQRNRFVQGNRFRGQRNAAQQGNAWSAAAPMAGTGYGQPTAPDGAAAYGPVPPVGVPPVGTPQTPGRGKRRGPGSGIVAITAGAALVVGGTLKALDAGHLLQLGTSVNAVAWAAGAAVLGLGIVAAGLRGRSSGLLGLLAVVALVAGSAFTMAPRGVDRFTFHDVHWTPSSVDEARQGVDITGAKGVVDLSGLVPGSQLPSEVAVPVNATASDVTVIIPANVPVQVTADMTFGNLSENGGDRGGQLHNDRTAYNTDKSGPALVVAVDGTFSNVTIKEGK